MRGVVAPEPPSSLHPAALPHRIWCCSCSQLCCAAPRPKMFAPIIFAEVTACSNVAELWPHNTSRVTTGFLFPVNIKISWAERIVLFLFSLMVVGFFYMFVTHTDTSSGWLAVEGAGRMKAEPRAVSELVCVMSLHWVEVMALRGIAGHPAISGFVQTPFGMQIRCFREQLMWIASSEKIKGKWSGMTKKWEFSVYQVQLSGWSCWKDVSLGVTSKQEKINSLNFIFHFCYCALLYLYIFFTVPHARLVFLQVFYNSICFSGLKAR